jgi:RNA polymerase sigma-70 factor, ECF subfamily
MSHALTPSPSLFERARAGDADSLGRLLRRYFRYLAALSQGQLDDRIQMRVSPSDIVQETLLEAHRDFSGFAGTSLEEFTGWLRRILFNNLAKAIERHVLAARRDVRKERSIEQRPADASAARPGLAELLSGGMPTASAALQKNESLERLTEAIGQLPASYRQVIEMRHFEGLSFGEIAALLGRSPGATRMVWLRAVERLKLLLGDSE